MYLLLCKLFLTGFQVQQKRWKVETFSRLDSVLLLSSVNLPGGVLVSPVAMVTTRPCARSQGVPSRILRLPCTTALASFPGSSPAFQWHNDIFPCNTCSLPPSSEATKVLQLYIHVALAFFLSYMQRRRSTQDELMMREYFQEGDLISVGNFSSQFLFLLV